MQHPTYQCARCAVVKVLPHLGQSGAAGYATIGAEKICYDCADAMQRADMLDRSGPFYCYLSSNGCDVTTWTGGKLGRVHASKQSRSGWNGSLIYRFHVRDVHGQWWQGRGAGEGMCCTLRPMNRPSYSNSWGAHLAGSRAQEKHNLETYSEAF